MDFSLGLDNVLLYETGMLAQAGFLLLGLRFYSGNFSKMVFGLLFFFRHRTATSISSEKRECWLGLDIILDKRVILCYSSSSNTVSDFPIFLVYRYLQ